VEATYTINNMPAGTYYVWLKISIPTGSTSNNFGAFVGFGTTLNPNYLKPKVENAYTWVRSSVNFTVTTAGTNTFIMGHGLALAQIDQIVITNSWESTLPASMMIFTSIKQSQNRKTSSESPGIVPKTLSGGKISFGVRGENIKGISLNIYSVNGSLVKSFSQNEMLNHSFIWDGASSQLQPVLSGIYVAVMHTGNGSKQIRVFQNR
jgi:hypothetical protein